MFKILSVFKKRSETDESASAPTATAPQVAAPMTEEYWARRRAPQFANLSGWTRDWLQALPEAVRPIELSVQHPHVANRLALSWRDAAIAGNIFDELLADKRKGRKGFAPAVVSELLHLRDFQAHGRIPGSASTDVDRPSSEGTATDSDWVHLRAPRRATDMVLSSTAREWLETLPEATRPMQLCTAYPRVANRLARCWNDPASTGQLFDDLLIGKRGKRKGFPGPVAAELLRLRRYHDDYRRVEVERTVWDHRTLAASDR